MQMWWVYRTLLAMLLLVNVTSGLRFIKEPSDEVAVVLKPFRWDCSASDETNPVTYSWTFNQQSLPLNANQVIYSNGTLYIGRLTSAEVGVYVCTATSSGDTITSREAKLDMAYIDLNFRTSPASQTAFLEHIVKMSCQITSLPPALVTWSLNGKTVTQGTITTSSEGESTLTLSPVLYQDAGEYKCIGTNPLMDVFRYSADATLVVQGRPVFLSSLKPVSVPLGFTATFNCGFYGNPKPEVRWLLHRTMEDGTISTTTLPNSDKYRYFQNGTFHIFDVTYEDGGFYTCDTENLFGQISESARLTVTGEAEKPVMIGKPVNTSVVVGDPAMMNCDCTGNPEPRVYWTKAGSVLESSAIVSVHENGSLSLLSVQTSDMGWFSCWCENVVGSVSQSAFLDVQVAPTIDVSPTNIVVRDGDTLLLHCHTEGNPVPYVSWVTPYSVTVSATQMASGYTVFKNGSLQLQSASEEDAGKYTCIAKNRIGSVNQSVTVKVEVPPKFILQPVSQNIRVGERVFLHCQAKGIPSPDYTWSKEGEGLIRSTSLRQIYLNNTLVLHSVTLEDAGVYNCSAANTRGEVNAVATLVVIEPPSFSVQPISQKVKVGSTVQLTCVAIGYPVPTQRWIKDGRQLILDDNMVAMPDNSQLTIMGIRESQFGRYECLATNMAGVVSAMALIETQDYPVLTVAPQNTTVSQSGSFNLQCQGQAEETPSVLWYKGRAGKKTLLQSSGRVIISGAGDLSLKSVTNLDEGWYTCVVRNSVGEVSAEVFVDVKVPPLIYYTNSPQKVLGRDSVTLLCQASGDPAPTLQWIRPSGVVIQPSSTYLISGNTLKIEVANGHEDAGDWTCKACNSLGCDTETIRVIIEGTPQVERFQGSKIGNIVTLTCNVKGEPSPTVTFASEGQQVTMATRGHSVTGNVLGIEEDYVKPVYTCQAQNTHGTATRTVTVPHQASPPYLDSVGSSWVTVRWSAPTVITSSLPLTSYQLQKSSNQGMSWQDVADKLTSRYLNVTGLDPYSVYSFRVAAVNILGNGMYSESSAEVHTLPGAPTPPTSLVTLELGEGTYLLIWSPPTNMNGPVEDIGYEYKITESSMGNNQVTVHHQGRILHNQSRELEIQVSDPGVYVVMLSALNIQLNLSSEAVTVKIDTTTSGQQPGEKTPESETKPDKIIAIVFGILGGVVIVFIIIFIIKYVRTQRKSESMSLVDSRLPLDQFYMENPKHLYRTESKLSIKRRSCHSFYSFQEDDSFHGSRSILKDGTPKKRAKPDNDVLLVARNPLYHDREMLNLPVISSRETTPEHQITKSVEESCAQTEITAPMPNVTEQSSQKSSVTGSDVTEPQNMDSTTKSKEAITPLSAKDLEEDIMKIYSSMNSDGSSIPSYSADQNMDHIYSSIHSEGQSSRSMDTSLQDSKPDGLKDNNIILQKLSNRVVSPDIVGNDSVSQSLRTNSSTVPNKSNTSSIPQSPKLHKNHLNNRHMSTSPKPPVKVLSLDGLRPKTLTYSKPETYKSTAYSEDSVPLVQVHIEKEINNDEDSSDTDSLFTVKGGNHVERVRPLDLKIEDNLLSDDEYHRDVIVADLY